MNKKKSDLNLKQVMENILEEAGFKRYFKKIRNLLKEYMDMREEYYSLVALWIIGTYIHKQFASYPYLYFNAMKGSGKSRILKFIENLSKNGKRANNITEGVLFRTAYERTLCIDEFERMNDKKNDAIKELLNSAYKRGAIVERLSKRKVEGSEQYIPEEFKVYCPIAIANIWGMDNVLGDRCIPVILEKSSKREIVDLIECFESDIEFQIIRGGLKRLTENISNSSNIFGDVFQSWKKFSQGKHDTKDTKDSTTALFKKIKEANVSGRNLELFFPLFIIADICGDKVLKEILKFSQKVIKEKREKDRDENIDVQIYEFIAQYPNSNFVEISTLVNDFKKFIERDESWINNTFFGRGLSRLNLVLKRRHQHKREVLLDIEKAKEQIKKFKEPDEIKTIELDEVFNG